MTQVRVQVSEFQQQTQHKQMGVAGLKKQLIHSKLYFTPGYFACIAKYQVLAGSSTKHAPSRFRWLPASVAANCVFVLSSSSSLASVPNHSRPIGHAMKTRDVPSRIIIWIPLRDPAAEREMWLARCAGPTFVPSSSPSHVVLVLVLQQTFLSIKEKKGTFQGGCGVPECPEHQSLEIHGTGTPQLVPY
ncbi:predicted protein [Histoplasma capsulatum var. duboisii H88]|uniref:Predicted protein n=1 Tax=Ajellomyces capsulatus (strain H88) TaxID=544711 RepID=F0U4R2_AJEC8|nr:predicted protein [Histoplasma capsulatum var. duboisii H88]